MDKRASKGFARHRARAAQKPASLKKRLKTFLAVAALVFLSLLAVVSVFVLVVFAQVSRNTPVDEIGNFKPSEGTVIYYADGPVMAKLATENRTPVSLNEMSRFLIDATISTEDVRFYEHSGVDMRGVARAVWRNVSGGDLTGQGASTITQQLARNIAELGLTKQKRFRRKVAEAILAMRIEQTYTKDQILEFYLNQIYYGNGAYGCDAAARAYFHKSAKDLTLSQAAMLAGLPQRPSLYSENHDAAIRRRDWVLQKMLDAGKITQEQYSDALGKNDRMYKAQPHGTTVYSAHFFVNYVVSQLVQKFGSDTIYRGCKIYTTLDSRIQASAEQALHDGIRKYSDDANQAALVSIDPKTGYIRAMVGGLDFAKQQFNVVTSGNRQPGSTFKPIVYAAAIDTGRCDLDSTYVDDPYFPGRHEGNTWLPKNYGGRYSRSSVTVLSAIKQSLNTVPVKVAMETGLQTVIDYAHRMGISSEIDAYPTLALGAFKSGVHPLELCSAYTVFANDGKRCLPMAITRVEQANGDIIDEYTPSSDDTRLKPNTLKLMNTALQEVVLHGTGTAAADVPNAHGKTGTTSDNRDAWFAGYTPELATVIWAGHEQRNRQGRGVRYLEMPGATGGHVCAPIWRDFMLKAVPIQQAANRAGTAQAKPADEDSDSKEEKPHTHTEKPAATAVKHETEPTAVPDGTEATPDATKDGGTGGVQPEGGVQTPDALSNPASPTAPSATTPRGGSGGGSARSGGEDDMVTVTVCADSGRRATNWCPATVERRMHRREVPGPCRLHRPPPGEQ